MAEDSETLRFYNFLRRYDLHRYHQKFVDMGVHKISHLKDVDDDDLELVGLSRPERNRLRKKVEKNFSFAGKLRNSVLGKSKKFDGPSGEEKEKDIGQVQSPNESQPQQQGLLPAPAPTVISSKQIKLGRQIGQGAFGAVHEATCTNAHGSVAVAVKFLTTRQSDEAYQTFHKEVASMSCLNHPHIIKLYGIVLDSPMALIEELAPLGDLHSHLLDSKMPFKFQLLHTYSCQLADAMQYLESQRTIHRDLATRNILLVKEDFIKLSDFGMARVLGEHSSVYNLSNLNTRIPIAWSSLEALQRAKFSTASDVWSYGVTLWEIYSLGAAPWEGLSPVEIRDKLGVGERLGRPSLCPVEIYRLMEACWNAIPTKRPTFQYIHQSMQELSPKKVLAIRSHVVDGEDILSFKAGEFIYVIDKPKPGWVYGVKATGEKGHFQEECVTTELDPLGKLKEQMLKGKMKVDDLSISKPTFVGHDYHLGCDGKQWVSDDAPDGARVMIPKAPSTPAGLRTNSPTGDTSPDSPSPSPSPPLGAGGRYFVVAEPMSPPSSDQLYQCHSSDNIPTTAQQPMSQGYTQGSSSPYVTANKKTSPLGDCVGTSKFGALGSYATPPHKHSEGDNCECMAAGQRQQQGSNGSIAANRSPKEGYTGDYGNDTEDPTPTEDAEYMELSSPSAKVAEEMGYLQMRSYPLIHQQSLLIECGSGHQRRSNRSDSEIQTRDFQENRGLGDGSRTSVGSTEGMLSSSGSIQASVDPPVPSMKHRQSLPLSPPPVPFRPSTGLLDSPIAMVSGGALPPPMLQLPRSPHSGKEIPAVPPRAVGSPNRSSNAEPKTKGQPPIPLPRKCTSIPLPEQQIIPVPGPTPKSNYVANIGHRDMPLVDVLQLECPDVDPFTCKRALEAHNYNIAEAKEHLQMEQLMAMGIPNTTLQDCRRALEHCHHSVDRAAEWLLDSKAGIKR